MAFKLLAEVQQQAHGQQKPNSKALNKEIEGKIL